jgi:hypothetical protein
LIPLGLAKIGFPSLSLAINVLFINNVYTSYKQDIYI